MSTESRINSCEKCATDFEVQIQRKSYIHRIIATVTLTSWRDLGPRGQYTNIIWQSQCHDEDWGDCEDFSRYQYDYISNPDGVLRSLKDFWEDAVEETS
jgi:hypothetical protein